LKKFFFPFIVPLFVNRYIREFTWIRAGQKTNNRQNKWKERVREQEQTVTLITHRAPKNKITERHVTLVGREL